MMHEKNIAITECESCHLEHKGMRVTLNMNELTYCKNCHEDLVMKNDPLDISHEDLIKSGLWSSCLQCHDFHGNHFMETAEELKDTISYIAIKAYLEGAESPYGKEKKYKAKESPDEILIENKKK